MADCFASGLELLIGAEVNAAGSGADWSCDKSSLASTRNVFPAERKTIYHLSLMKRNVKLRERPTESRNQPGKGLK